MSSPSVNPSTLFLGKLVVCGGLWSFVVVCGVLWWFVVFSATPVGVIMRVIKTFNSVGYNSLWESSKPSTLRDSLCHQKLQLYGTHYESHQNRQPCGTHYGSQQNLQFCTTHYGSHQNLQFYGYHHWSH